MKKTKKGFTLVELLVVIAILAILSVVSIIGFSSYTKKAKLSNDVSLVTQVNEVLRSAESLGEVPTNMWEAKELIKESTGYDITKNNTILTQYANIGYDVRENCVVLISNLTNPNTDVTIIECPEGYVPHSTYDIFVPMNNVYNNLYSTYLVDATSTEFDTNKGLDVGDCKGITTINYENNGDARDVVIRTDDYNTVINVDAKLDTIKHYGKANKIDIYNIATSSYHENGDILGNITIYNGRVVLESGVNANAVYVDATAQDITNGVVVISADNTRASSIPIIVREDVKTAADTKGGKNSIPNPQIENVVVLYDKVLDSQGNKTNVDAVAYLTSNKKNYASLQSALDDMVGNDTVVLIKDIDDCTCLQFNKNNNKTYKLDMNGCEISFTSENVSADAMAFEIKGTANVIINNGTFTAESYKYGDVLEIWANTTLNMVRVNFTDEKVDGYSGVWGCIYNGAELLTLNNCYINGIKGPGIQNGEEDSKIVINNSTVISDNHSALYCGGSSITEVNNSTITGVRAVHACTSGATFYLNSGTFTGSSNVIQLDNTTSAVDWQGTPNYAGGSYAYIYGGTYSGNIQVVNYANNKGVALLVISGGSITGTIPTQNNIVDNR